MVPVECYFVLSALLFFIGVYGFITRRNLIARKCCCYRDYYQRLPQFP